MGDGPEEPRAPYLPDGYSLDEASNPGILVLRRGDGSAVAHFIARVAVTEWIERAAWEDGRGREG